MAKAKARQRALEKKLGTTGTDPFIPARNARPLPGPTIVPVSTTPPRGSRQQFARRWRLVFAAWAIALALPFGVWMPFIGNALMDLRLPLLATRLGILGIIYLGIAILTIARVRQH